MPPARSTALAAVLLLGAGCLGLSACSSAVGTASQPTEPTATATAGTVQPLPTGSVEPMPGDSDAPSTMPSGMAPSTTTLASPSARATIDPHAKVIYLTFDDGPWVPYTDEMLKVLAKNDATATFFVVGQMVKAHPGLVPKILAAGHAVGNHTWNHPNLTTLSDHEIKQQVRWTERVVGPEISPCLRPPYGATNEHIRSLVASLGYRTVLWTDWAVDWEQPPVPTLLNYLDKATHNHANILLHDGGGDRPNTVAAVRIMLPRWRKMGYTFAAVPACEKPPL